ncbi:MAG TPA: CinA family protein, partial [Asticcacaulis sp.]
MPINRLAKQVVDELRGRRMTIATVESCTGGLLSAAITGVAGASDVFGYGFVTYANAAKT